MGQINTYCLRKCKLPHIYTQDDGKCLWKLNALRTIPIYSVGVIVRICKMTYYETTNSYETIALSSIDGRLVKYSICYTSVIKYHIAVEWILIGTLCINIKIPLSKTFLIKWEKSSVQNILYSVDATTCVQPEENYAYLCLFMHKYLWKCKNQVMGRKTGWQEMVQALQRMPIYIFSFWIMWMN